MNPAAKWARLVVRLRFAIVAGWIVGAAVVTVTLPDIRQAQVGALGDPPTLETLSLF